MAKYKSIEEYRNKKKMKSFLKAFVTLVIIAGILIGLVNVLQLFKGTPISDLLDETTNDTEESFPIMIKDEQLVDLYNLGNNISVLTKANNINYLANGKRGTNTAHGYTNPVVKEGNKRILIYDRGGNSFKVNTTSSTVGEIKLENKIISAQIADNGNVAVVTNHTQYASIITVYDNNLKEIFKYSSGERITFVNFAPDGKTLLAAALISDNTYISANILEINITKDTPANKITLRDVFLLDISYNADGEIVAICSDKIITYSKRDKLQKAYEYKGELVCFTSSTVQETVVVTKNPINDKAEVNVVGVDGVSKAHITLNDEIKDIYCDGSRIILLGKNSAYNFDMSLLLLNQIELERAYIKIIFSGESMYILGIDRVDKFSIS